MSLIGTKTIIATIAAGASLSDAIVVDGFNILRIGMPAAWDAAELTFQIDDGDGTFRELYFDWGGEIWAATEAGVSVELGVFLPLHSLHKIKIRSGTAGVPIAQTVKSLLSVVVGAK